MNRNAKVFYEMLKRLGVQQGDCSKKEPYPDGFLVLVVGGKVCGAVLKHKLPEKYQRLIESDGHGRNGIVGVHGVLVATPGERPNFWVPLKEL
jgi:hypothetical protein